MGFSISRQQISDGKPPLSGEGGEGKQGWRFGSSFPHFQTELFVFMQCSQHELLSWKHTLTDSIRVGFRNETAFSFVYRKRSSSLQNWKP